MSNRDNEYKGSTLKQLILVIPGAILAFTLLISLIAKTSSILSTPAAEVPQAVVAQVEENIKPLANVEVAVADAGPHVDKSGEEVVNAVCSACHASGLMSSPKLGDKDQWAPRIAQGYDTLVSNAINGIRSMPARGGNSALTDGEMANAVAYMANQSGANFTAPTSKTDVPSDLKPAEATPAAAVPAPKVVEKKTESVAVVEKPTVSAVVVNAAPAASKGKSGQEVYKAVCSMCHSGGLMGAPKLGDKEQWAPRIAQGHDTLVTHAVKGIRMMPAKGGNADLSDNEVADAVTYMANEAGAKF
ncbi:MAG: c-type cytochrome [Methylotenera sp.]|uniref:c-type cytochrome n=1 Tax=Methylotenera sp. TaxID=2051956 RepID=UPI0024889266|nr:c-type cytochrome [Methylotenera sp.]MDI1310203.1 c-type cytochrome [Methylotenera sp.]